MSSIPLNVSRETFLDNVTFKGFPKRIFIYSIKDELEKIVYIGSTSYPIKSRIRTHISDAKYGSNLPIHVWMRDKNYRFSVEFIEEIDYFDRVTIEKKWVSMYEGLLNVTDGGGGMSGHKFAGTEHANRISQGLKTGEYFNCKECDKSFWRKQREIKLGHNKFCSRKCFQLSQSTGRMKKCK